MSRIISVGPQYWSSVDLKHLVIFGASYCAVGYGPDKPHPTPNNPLGVPWPGMTWTEADKPNWVGHLITNQLKSNSLLVYNYAVGGATVDGVQQQIEKQFLPHVGKRPDWAPWDSASALFMTWVGINDVAMLSALNQPVHPRIDALFKLQDKLYAKGARNFFFFGVPPMHRAPGARGHNPSLEDSPHHKWNVYLESSAEAFAATHEDATVVLFSSWNTFTRVLDDPEQYGFAGDDPVRSRGGIWVDDMHPTSAMHAVIAKEVALLIKSVDF